MAATIKHEMKETCKEMVLAHPQESKQLDFAAMEDGVFFIGFINRNILKKLTARGQAYQMFGDEPDSSFMFVTRTNEGLFVVRRRAEKIRRRFIFEDAEEVEAEDDLFFRRIVESIKRRFMFEAADQKELEDGEIYMDLVRGHDIPPRRFRLRAGIHKRLNVECCMELVGAGADQDPIAGIF